MRVTPATASLAAVLVSATVATGCGGGKGDDAGQAVDVRFTRADGSIAEFTQVVRSWCGPFDENNPEVEAVHVLAGVRPQDETPDPFWTLIAVRAHVEREPRVVLPAGFVYEAPRGAILFALDDAEHRHNELSSADEESEGETPSRWTAASWAIPSR